MHTGIEQIQIYQFMRSVFHCIIFTLKGMDTHSRETTSEKGSTNSKWKELGANSFILEKTPLSKGLVCRKTTESNKSYLPCQNDGNSAKCIMSSYIIRHG